MWRADHRPNYRHEIEKCLLNFKCGQCCFEELALLVKIDHVVHWLCLLSNRRQLVPKPSPKICTDRISISFVILDNIAVADAVLRDCRRGNEDIPDRRGNRISRKCP